MPEKKIQLVIIYLIVLIITGGLLAAFINPAIFSNVILEVSSPINPGIFTFLIFLTVAVAFIGVYRAISQESR